MFLMPRSLRALFVLTTVCACTLAIAIYRPIWCFGLWLIGPALWLIYTGVRMQDCFAKSTGTKARMEVFGFVRAVLGHSLLWNAVFFIIVWPSFENQVTPNTALG